MAKSGLPLRQPREWYLYNNLRSGDIKDIRKEYSRLRKAFNRAVDRGFGDFSARVQHQRQQHMPVLKGLSDTDIRHNLAEMVNASHSRGFTAAGRRAIEKESYETLKARGVKGVTRQNLRQYLSFLNFVSKLRGSKYTEEDLKTFDQAFRRGFDIDNLRSQWDFYATHSEEISRIPMNNKAKRAAMINDLERRAIISRRT